MGHRVLSVVSFGGGVPRLVREPRSTASYFEWASVDIRLDLACGGLQLPLPEDGLYRFEPPETFCGP